MTYALSPSQQRKGRRNDRYCVGIREIARLRKRYGRGRWRKRKGIAEIELATGEIVSAEVDWYEATGIGRREFKVKRLL